MEDDGSNGETGLGRDVITHLQSVEEQGIRPFQTQAEPALYLPNGVRVLNAAPMINGARVGEVGTAEFAEFLETHYDQLVAIKRALLLMRARKVVLEAAHIYGYEDPGIDHYLQMRVAAMLSRSLKDDGFDVVNLLFIDDLHSGGKINFDIQSYVREAALRGWSIDDIFFENDMRELAEIMTSTLLSAGKATVVNKETVLAKRGIHLVKTNNRSESLEPSCAALDAAFTNLKLSIYQAGATLNVLPHGRGYKQQQQNTRTILREALDEPVLPFLNFYVNLESNGPPRHKAGRPHQYG